MKARFRAVVGSNIIKRANGKFKLFRYIEIQQEGKWIPFRDHSWISYNWNRAKILNKLKLHQVIEFTADVEEYMDSQLQKKYALHKIRSVGVIGYKKLK